jgi:sulfatase maturation enzyme AslB (radical SAM superfamily)
MVTLPFLETMITQVCNLSCEGCTNYSDLLHQGYVPWEQGKEWLQEWNQRIDITDFGIMGGEPLINPQFREWLVGCRELMPSAQLRFTTNGLLLEKHWDVIDLMADLGNVSFKITVHLNDSVLEQTIEKIFKRYNWQPIHEYGIDRWITGNNFRFHVKRPDKFIKTFKNNYENMEPWNSNPEDAFSNCIQTTCPLLYNGRIYKCSTAGLLTDVLERFDNPNFEKWKQYVNSGIGLESSDADIEKFVRNFGKPNAICGQCPSVTQTESVVLHNLTVKRK